MSTDIIPDRRPNQTIQFSWINIIRDVLTGVFVPRDLTGTPRANYSRIGTESYLWKNLHVQIAHLGLGDVFHFHDFAGNVTIPQGWMLCNGAIINEANYDSQHSTGDWDNYVVSSVLNGLYLPNMDLAYVKGKTGTLQAGSAPITTVGQSTRDFSHDHGSPKFTTTPTPGPVNINTGGASEYYFGNPGHGHTFTIPSALSATQDMRPSSTAVKVIMRIV